MRTRPAPTAQAEPPADGPTLPARAGGPRRAAWLARWTGAGSAGIAAALLAACSSTPVAPPPPAAATAPPTTYATDGPLPNPPPNLIETPDPEPRIEPVRAGGPNKPYQALGEVYVPISDDRPLVQKGLASWYGRKFHGRPTASGELYNMYALSAAHPTLPIPSYARVRNPANGREVIVRINDRGPFAKGRIVDLSYTAALKLDVLRGVAMVELERITHESIRTGRWRRDAALPDGAVVASADTADLPPGTPVRGRELWGQELALEPPSAGVVKVSAQPQPLPREPSAGAAVDVPAPAPSPARSTRTADAVQIDAARTAAGRGWWLQVGAFKELQGAQRLQQQLAQSAGWLAPLLALFDERGLHKLQLGPFPTRGEALSAMQRVKSGLALTPVLVERR